MNDTTAPSYLQHHFLIAMPQLADPHFAQTVIYLIDHNESGAMGLVINRSTGLSLAHVLDQLRADLQAAPHCQDLPILAGGPVQTDRGFVLHPRGWQYQATHELGEGELALSTSLDSLVAIAEGHGPQRCLIALGYAGWGAGQLEAELLDNAWLTCAADPAILFDTPLEERLQCAAASLGIDLALLAREAGHA